MIKTKIMYGVAALIGVLFFVLVVCVGGATAHAESPVIGADGTYSVTVGNDMTMGGKSISSDGKVEKSGDKYYASISFDTSALSEISLLLDDMKVGFMESVSENWTTYTYTLSAANLARPLPFSATVNAMKRSVSFNVTLALVGASRTSDEIADRGERPAEFVPIISTEAAKEYEATQGAAIVIPSATAAMGAKSCTVSATAYYLSAGAAQSVDLSEVDEGCGITLANVGEYHIVYKASSNAYKTSFGNDTFAEYDITVISSIGGGSLAKFTDEKGVLAEGTGIMASRISSGSSVYTLAAEKMASIADKFEVFAVRFIHSDGTTAELTDSVTLYLQADATFDRTKTVVCHLSADGNLTELSSDGYGRYIMFDTTQAGTFIVLVQGVAFIMPMWGYLIIVIAAALVLAAGIVFTIVLIRKKKKIG